MQSGSELSSICSVLQQPGDSFGNDASLEMMWAVRAYEHAEIYFNLLVSVDPLFLNLSPADDDIYKEFRKTFPALSVNVVNEEEIKSNESKAVWREFCNRFEGKVDDWNMATLLRLDCEKDVSESNTTIVPRIQFLAIEIARNREGANSLLRSLFPRSKDDSCKGNS